MNFRNLDPHSMKIQILRLQEQIAVGILNSSWLFNYTEDVWLPENPFYHIHGTAESKDKLWKIDVETLCGHALFFHCTKSGETVFMLDLADDDHHNHKQHLEFTEIVESCLYLWRSANAQVIAESLSLLDAKESNQELLKKTSVSNSDPLSSCSHLLEEFIDDKELQRLLVCNLNEAREAFQQNLYKSVVVLCGAIIEAVLMYIITSRKEKAKEEYSKQYQRFNEGIRNRVDDIGKWELWQLIDIAQRMGVINNTRAKTLTVAREFRNLIHIHKQYEIDEMELDFSVASFMVSALNITSNSIMKWCTKQANIT